MAMDAATKGRNVLILVHRKELWAQTSATLDKYDAPHGIIARGQTFTNEKIQVASVQTLVRRQDKIDWRPDLIVVDEGHHAVQGSTYSKIIDRYDSPRLVLVTATPERLDGKGLGIPSGGFADALILGPMVQELTDAGYLSPAMVYGPPKEKEVDLSEVHTQMGDWNKRELDDAMSKPVIVGDAVEHYRRMAPGEPTIVFCTSIKHAKMTAESFRAAGFNFRHIAGGNVMSDDERKECLDGLASGAIQGLTSCDIISEGTDVPVVSVGILLRPTQSKALFLQQVGRVLRVSDGKDRALILDHAGNTRRHGLPTQVHEWTLEGRKKKNKKETEKEKCPIRQCPECFAFDDPVPVCRNCGYKFETKSRVVEEVAGTLELITETNIKEEKKKERKEEREAKTYSDFYHLAQGRGYKSPASFATKKMVGRAKTPADLVEVGRVSGKRNPGAWASYMWRVKIAQRQGRKRA